MTPKPEVSPLIRKGKKGKQKISAIPLSLNAAHELFTKYIFYDSF